MLELRALSNRLHTLEYDTLQPPLSRFSSNSLLTIQYTPLCRDTIGTTPALPDPASEQRDAQRQQEIAKLAADYRGLEQQVYAYNNYIFMVCAYVFVERLCWFSGWYTGGQCFATEPVSR